MPLIEINKHPSPGELRSFGWLFLLGGAALAAGWYLWRGSLLVPGIALAAAALVTLVFAVWPSARRPIYLGWMYAALPLGWLVSHLVLAVVYYLLLTPLGLVLRLFRADPLCRRFVPGADSYWTPRQPDVETARYFRQS